jgi:predicted ATPase
MLYFYVYRAPKRPKPRKVQYPAVFLFDDNWDDFGYKTLFKSSIQLDADSREIELGEVKILEISDEGPISSPRIDDHFTSLEATFCSLGQSVRYYRHLRDDLPVGVRREYLKSFRDIVSRPKQRERFERHPGFETSLLRNGSARDALRRGGHYIDAPVQELEPPSFDFKMTLPGSKAPHEVHIDFTPHHGLPHRINLLIGRNGTGKTQFLAHLAQSLYGVGQLEDDENELLGTADIVAGKPEFSKIIAISYSAFDEFPIPKGEPRRGRKTLFDYKYCGLRNASGAIDVDELKIMLDGAMEAVKSEDRIDIFQSLADRLLGTRVAGEFAADKTYRDQLFGRLSAGQRFIIAVAADVVGFIEERSILLFDEPETHLHPGLLSTLIAILDEILREYQSFAIIATHSPILLQQVPRRYVRVLKRRGSRTTIGLPTLETFGEDLGELTRHVLDLTEPEQDFHAVLDRLVAEGLSAEQIEAMFERGLPLAARIYLESLTLEDEG